MATSRIAAMLSAGPEDGDVARHLEELRTAVLEDGIPSNPDGMSEYRVYVWLIFLNALPISTNDHLGVVDLKASAAHNKIVQDLHRTFQGDSNFKVRVTANSLCRVLNAMAWKMIDRHENGLNSAAITGGNSGQNQHIGYKQGLNILAGVLLYAGKSETEAIACLDKLLYAEMPGYYRNIHMAGAKKGCKLVDEILSIVDPELYKYLERKQLIAEVYAFRAVITLSACAEPLLEVLKLWDFLFAYGVHTNIICIVAQLVLVREDLLSTKMPSTIIGRDWPRLHADNVKALTMRLVGKLPEELYLRVLNHAQVDRVY
ncbi:TBC-domain-containing protein [Rhizodiscina lignyota]|uniref:TBC-domain-containing protein n=1 Tax=Rhizodiscina lignyota TaxID=1504668 RepID=A0A9P4MB33_9PEZI|nr:TBC-domain-containing protein [Rhizodiscina lignyota]